LDEKSSRSRTAAPEDIALLSACARLLFENGETTRWMVRAVERLGAALGFRATVYPRWGELNVRVDDTAGARYDIIAASPLGVDMSKVAATIAIVDELCDGGINAIEARASIEAVGRRKSVALPRFALMAGAGAAALGVIFGVTDIAALVIIACSAAAGGCLRRFLASISSNPFIQPFCAALLAGVIGVLAVRFHVSSPQRLIALCPCMVLVPGPHLLNGTIDLTRGRIALGASRVAYASGITLAICAGLILGLSLGSVDLPVSTAMQSVPLSYDVVAAGIAVAAYGTFFALPWRMLPIPILIGMAAHASRWAIITLAGGSAETGALVACLLVGIVVTPITDRLRLPFAAFAFASVVSMIPGVYLFHMADGLIQLVNQGHAASFDLLRGTIVDGITALLIVLVMTFGLIVPKMCIENFYPPYADASGKRGLGAKPH
jgi:uncharacterized membrane protein YjjP (DUF1212 family)